MCGRQFIGCFVDGYEQNEKMEILLSFKIFFLLKSRYYIVSDLNCEL